ncbi:ISL3 family transposase [Methylobacterium ajmalii]|uniref:ISL3 family transposase n=1 Tax=Methylobacterium ajmalii TaxID=2738439 RepID=A0ABV0A256_9HYPH
MTPDKGARLLNALLFRNWTVEDAFETTASSYVFTASYDLSPEHCPKCGSLRKPYKHKPQVFEYRDAPMHGKRVIVRTTIVRYRCQDCGKTFNQQPPELDPDRAMTRRLVEYVQDRGLRRPYAEVAREVGFASDKTVREICKPYLDELITGHTVYAPVAMGLDETKLDGKKRTVISDIALGKVIDVLEDDSEATIRAWLKNLPMNNRIIVVTMDMSGSFRKVVREVLPWAQIIADRWHIQKKSNEALDRLRNERRHVNNAERREAKSARRKMPPKVINTWGDRRTLHMGRKKLAKYAIKFPMGHALFLARLANDPLVGSAWRTKEAFYSIWDATSRKEAECLFDYWKTNIPKNVSHVFKPIAETIDRWREEVFAFFDHPYTNAYAESNNNLIKTINRAGRGYRFEGIRARAISMTKLKPHTHVVCEDCLAPVPVKEAVTKTFISDILPPIQTCPKCVRPLGMSLYRALAFGRIPHSNP